MFGNEAKIEEGSWDGRLHDHHGRAVEAPGCCEEWKVGPMPRANDEGGLLLCREQFPHGLARFMDSEWGKLLEIPREGQGLVVVASLAVSDQP